MRCCQKQAFFPNSIGSYHNEGFRVANMRFHLFKGGRNHFHLMREYVFWIAVGGIQKQIVYRLLTQILVVSVAWIKSKVAKGSVVCQRRWPTRYEDAACHSKAQRGSWRHQGNDWHRTRSLLRCQWSILDAFLVERCIAVAL